MTPCQPLTKPRALLQPGLGLRRPQPRGGAWQEAIAEDLTAGRFFRLVDGKGRELAVGRLYDSSGANELAPLDDFGRRDLGALNIEFRAGGEWRPA